jgi:ribokinase
MSASARAPVISTIGVVSWDEIYLLDHYPQEGNFALISDSFTGPGGTTGNLAMAARRLGAQVSLVASIGRDERGNRIMDCLQTAGIDTGGCLRHDGETDLSIMLVSSGTAERTILWKQAPTIKRRDRMDIDALFRADLTVIDCVDYELRKFLTDLPAHTRPAARLLGTLTYLANVVADDKLEIALRHDILIGNEREYRQLVGCDDADDCLQTVASAMSGTTLRLAVMTCGERGSVAITRDQAVRVPARRVAAADATGAGDAFAGALAVAQALRWDIEQSLTLANAVASLVVTAIGAQTALPTMAEAITAAGLAP